MQLKNFDVEEFLRDYWQKKPLLIKNPWETWRNPIDPDALAGLACEEEVESRLVTQVNGNWIVENGPLPVARFGELGTFPWTVLVQAVDHYVAEVGALLAPFRFIPNWRIDDVMVSLASDSGGVGPHFDQYDVFLVQGLGKRRWRVGAQCDAGSELAPHDELRLLAQFEATDEWVLEPGDILYIPPRFAHDGVALGDDCMTYSIGFRAPSLSDLVGHYCDDLLENLCDDDRYCDPDLKRQSNPGEISEDAITELHAMVARTLGDRDAFARWFGCYNSTPKYSDVDWRPELPVDIGEIRELLGEGGLLCRNPASRFSFIRNSENRVSLFVDGECFECGGDSAVFAEQLCAQEQIVVANKLHGADDVVTLIVQLVNLGSLAIDEED